MAKKVASAESDVWATHPPGALLSAFTIGLIGLEALDGFFRMVRVFKTNAWRNHEDSQKMLFMGVTFIEDAYSELSRQDAGELRRKLDLIHQDDELIRHHETTGQSYGSIIFKLLLRWKTRLGALLDDRSSLERWTSEPAHRMPISVEKLLASPDLIRHASHDTPTVEIDRLKDLLLKEYRQAFPNAGELNEPKVASGIASVTRFIFPEEGDPRDLWMYLYEHQGNGTSDNELARKWSYDRGPSVLNKLRKARTDGAISDWR